MDAVNGATGIPEWRLVANGASPSHPKNLMGSVWKIAESESPLSARV
jgi:hypothetical protein